MRQVLSDDIKLNHHENLTLNFDPVTLNDPHRGHGVSHIHVVFGIVKHDIVLNFANHAAETGWHCICE